MSAWYMCLYSLLGLERIAGILCKHSKWRRRDRFSKISSHFPLCYAMYDEELNLVKSQKLRR